MYKPRPILKTYYDALESQKILGMRCEECADVAWPPLPTCQKCGSADMEWIELSGEATIEEFSFTRQNPGASGSFLKGSPYFETDEPYCLCTGRLKEGPAFNAALFGVTLDNVDELLLKLPMQTKAETIQLSEGFKSVGFRVAE